MSENGILCDVDDLLMISKCFTKPKFQKFEPNFIFRAIKVQTIKLLYISI